MSSFPVLRISNLGKTFTLHNHGSIALSVLRGVNLEVNAGECVALDGPSGSGKSTLLKLIYANYRASSGAVLVRCADPAANDDEVDVTHASSRQLLGLRQTTIGYVSQFLRVIPRVAALDVVAEPLVEQAGSDEPALKNAMDQAQHLLRRLRIPTRLWQLPPATFSGGEQQRINIARNLIRAKPLLLLDEPTASLDVENRATVSDLINEARQRGAAIVGIFHDAKVRDAVATRVVNMASFQ